MKRGTSKATQGNKGNVAEELKRSYFTIAKDITVLKSALQHNPWQLGEKNWTPVRDEVNLKLHGSLTVRSIKDRLKLLVNNYQKSQLAVKTGTEEEASERGLLLDEVIAVIEQSKSPINKELGAESEEETEPSLKCNAEVGFELKRKPKQENKCSEKRAADKERDELCASDSELADTPIAIRKKRGKLSPEDELIKEKLNHDMGMEVKRHIMEEEKQRENIALENKKLDIENKRMELEEKREDRKAEKNKRRDDLTKTQLEMQAEMFKLMGAFIHNKK